jgi:cell division protein ZapD
MDTSQRTDHLARWIRPLQPLQNALSLLLRLIRESSVPTRETARNGFFQQPLDSNSPTQMLRLTVDRRERIFPEISGGRHRFSIRFLSQDDPDHRATQVQRDIAFTLVCCVI